MTRVIRSQILPPFPSIASRVVEKNSPSPKPNKTWYVSWDIPYRQAFCSVDCYADHTTFQSLNPPQGQTSTADTYIHLSSNMLHPTVVVIQKVYIEQHMGPIGTVLYQITWQYVANISHQLKHYFDYYDFGYIIIFFNHIPLSALSFGWQKPHVFMWNSAVHITWTSSKD